MKAATVDMYQTHIYKTATVHPWICLLGCFASLCFMASLWVQDSVEDWLREPFLLFWGALIIAGLLGGIVWAIRQIRRPFVVRLRDSDMLVDGKEIPFDSIRDLTLQEHEYGGEGDISPLLCSLFPKIFPDTYLVVDYLIDGKRERVTISNIPAWEDLQARIRERASYLSVFADSTEGTEHEWEQEKQEILDALATSDSVDKAYAMDLLSKYAQLGVAEAAETLKHNAEMESQ